MGEEEELRAMGFDDAASGLLSSALRHARALDASDAELRLLMGELTAEEMRLVRAVINWAQRRILSS